ncbi:MAG: hypothetical protein C5B59_12940 [Bacteroidetes bacterium]|nr:MAG: hypothetical protein C5B59_12940 [Bacteroidota bacterium]
MSFRQYRKIEPNEFIVVGGDCSQGGNDENFAHFISKSKLDIPIVYEQHGVAAQMTSDIFPMLERIFDLTGIMPTVAFERNNGGASEMQRLYDLNRSNKYSVYQMPALGTTSGSTEKTDKLGWDTNTLTRPIMLQDWKSAFDRGSLLIYDKETIAQHKTFIVNKNGKPMGAPGKHDDAVMSLAIGWQLFIREIYTEVPPIKNDFSRWAI